MSEKANAIIESALAALRAEAEEIQGKIAALEGALGASGNVPVPTPAKKAPKKSKAPKAKRTPGKDMSKTDKLKEAANKRAASWTPEKKRAAAERMRRYWAERKKQAGGS